MSRKGEEFYTKAEEFIQKPSVRKQGRAPLRKRSAYSVADGVVHRGGINFLKLEMIFGGFGECRGRMRGEFIRIVPV